MEFNPTKVQAYRLIGYENRCWPQKILMMTKRMPANWVQGHTVTALYEVIPVGVKDEFTKSIDRLKYQTNNMTTQGRADEIMTIKLRYKKPDGDVSKLIVKPVVDGQSSLASTSDNFRFSAAVASFGMLLRGSEYKQSSTYQQVVSLANSAKGADKNGYRAEFIKLVEGASSIVKK